MSVGFLGFNLQKTSLEPRVARTKSTSRPMPAVGRRGEGEFGGWPILFFCVCVCVSQQKEADETPGRDLGCHGRVRVRELCCRPAAEALLPGASPTALRRR